MKKVILIAIMTICMTTAARADLYTDWYDPSDTKVTTSSSTWINHTHDITDDGFPHPLEYATSAELKMWLKDDNDLSSEYTVAIYDGVNWNIGDWFGWSTEVFDVSVNPSLVADGKLDITVKATKGDFYFNKSLLSVESDYVPIPVPGALLLGMLGLSAAGIKLRKHA